MALQVASRTSVQRHTVTLPEYDRMVEAGVFDPESRLELIRGEIIDMAPIGPEHEDAVTHLHHLLFPLCYQRAVMWPHGNSIGLPQSNSRPEPDLILLRWHDKLYRGTRPSAEDVLLLIEVSQSTLKFDQGAKLQLYAEAGIPEYWVVNIVDGVVEVHTVPVAGRYQTTRVARRGDTLPLPGGLAGAIAVLDILGPAPQAEGGSDA